MEALLPWSWESLVVPPAWLFAVLASPHAWYAWVLVHPASTKRVASWFRMEPVDWFADISLALNVAQLSSLAFYIVTSGHYDAWAILGRLAEEPWRALALPMFALGTVFKVTIFTAIGKIGVYYGAKFGHTIPWVHGFPFSVTGASPRAAATAQCVRTWGCSRLRARIVRRFRVSRPRRVPAIPRCSAPAVPGQLAVHLRRGLAAARRGAARQHAAGGVLGDAVPADRHFGGGRVPLVAAVFGAGQGRRSVPRHRLAPRGASHAAIAARRRALTCPCLL